MRSGCWRNVSASTTPCFWSAGRACTSTRSATAWTSFRPSIRICGKHSSARAQTEGLESLFEELRKLDPAHCEVMDRSNPQRVIRALEVCLQSGRPYSSLRKGEPKTRPFRILRVGLRMSRDVLYDRIDRRVDRMIADGLEREAQGIVSSPGMQLRCKRSATGSCSPISKAGDEPGAGHRTDQAQQSPLRETANDLVRKEYGHAMVRSRRRVRRKNRRLSERDDMTAAPLLSDKQIDTA